MISSSKVVMTKHFTGDILITDPCYICKEVDESTQPKLENYLTYPKESDYPDYGPTDVSTILPWGKFSSATYHNEYNRFREDMDIWRTKNPSHWHLCNYGYDFEVFGIHNYMTHSTLYGDWSCTVYNSDTSEPIGNFCADAGLVSVFLLDEVRIYNPDIDKWIEGHPWCATVIKGFDGDISYHHVHIEWVWEEDSDFHKAGDECCDDILVVESIGNINFTTRQTGL